MNAANSLILCLTKQDMNSWWLRRGVFKLSYCSESGNVGHSDLRGIGIIVSSSSWSLAMASFKWLFDSDFGTTRKASATGSGLAVSFAVLPPILRIGIRFSNFSWPDWAKVGFFFTQKSCLNHLSPSLSYTSSIHWLLRVQQLVQEIYLGNHFRRDKLRSSRSVIKLF